MTTVLSEKQQQEFLSRGFSRRTFGRIATMITAGAALPFYNEPALAQLSRVDAPPDAVMINSNENPLGPGKRPTKWWSRVAATCLGKPVR